MPPRRPTFLWRCLRWLGLGFEPRRKPTKGKKKKRKSKSAARAPAGDGRRIRPQGLEAFCRSVAAVRDDPWPARVRDLSTGSIGLHLTRRFEPGTLLVIELEKKDQSLTHTLVARVVNAIPSQTGTGWMVGCTLANKIAEDDLQALLL